MNNLKRGPSKSNTEIVYHYCSVDALFNIVSKRSIWLTNLLSSNDKKELMHGEKQLKTALLQLINDCKDQKQKAIYEGILTAPQNKELANYKNPMQFYGFSLTSRKDSLSHWERYSNNGQGVCIGFKLSVIDDFLDNLSLRSLSMNWLCHDKIIYEVNNQIEYLKQKIRRGNDNFFNAYIDQSMLDSTLSLMYFSAYYSLLSKVTPIFKDISFSDECEYRLYFEAGKFEDDFELIKRAKPGFDLHEFEDFNKRMIEFLGLSREQKQHVLIGNSIRSFYNMKLDEFWSSALIPEIIIGPRCFQQKRELESFIIANQLDDTKLYISKIPIR